MNKAVEEAEEATASNRIANGINGLTAFGFDSKKYVTFGSVSSEYEVSCVFALSVIDNPDKNKYEIHKK